MKRILSITLTIITLLTAFQTFTLSAFAATAGPNDFYYYTISEEEKTCGISRYLKYDYPDGIIIDDKTLDIVIPETMNGYSVVKFDITIDDAASVTYPKTIDKFGYCNASKIYLNNNSFYDLAAAKAGMLNCDELYLNGKLVTELKYPNGTTTVRNLGYCRSITSVTIPDSAKVIVDDAFGRHPNLKTVNLGKGVQKIGYWAFEGCSSLKSITLPNSLTEIGERAFEGTAIKEITVPSSVKKIGSNAFNGVSTIYGEKGSAAEKYAIDYGIKFVDINTITTTKPAPKETTTKKKTTTTTTTKPIEKITETTTEATTETTTELTTLEATTLESTTETVTQVVQSKDKTSNTPLIVGISVIAVVTLAGAGTAVWYFKFRKKNEE